MYLIYDFFHTDPGMAMDMEISITGAEPGKVIDNLYCYVMNMDEPLHLHVEADFKVVMIWSNK